MNMHTALAPTVAAPVAAVESRIQTLRGQRVLLDADLAGLYGVAMLSSVLTSPQAVIDTLRQLMTPPTPPKRPIGFTADVNGGQP